MGQALTIVWVLCLVGCATGGSIPEDNLPPKGEPNSADNPPTHVDEQPQPLPRPPASRPNPESPTPPPPPGRPAPPADESNPPAPPAEEPPQRERPQPPAEEPPQRERPQPPAGAPPAEEPPANERPAPPNDPNPPQNRAEPEPERRPVPPNDGDPAPQGRNVPPNAPPPNPCGQTDYAGFCDGDTAVWCDNGRVARTHCGRRFSASCGWVDDETGFFCQAPNGYVGPQEPEPAPEANDPAPPAGDCGQIDYLGVCEQDTVVWCQGGQLSRLNCADLQQTCGWIDDSSGNYCVDDPTRAPSPESETPEAPDDGCGDIDHNGVCEGDVAVWCSGGSLRRFDCRTERQQTCAWIDDTLGNYCVDDSSPEQAPEQVPPAEPDPEPIAPQDECGGLGYEGRCDGDIAVWCSSGTLQTVDCMQTLGQSCGWAGDDVGFYCLEPAAPQDPQDPPPGDPPADACGGLDFLGECAGDIARYCEFGQIREVDCAQSESTCGWIDDQTGHYCQ